MSGRRVRTAAARVGAMTVVVVLAGCAALVSAPEVESPDQALLAARQAAAQGRWAQAEKVLETAAGRAPQDARLPALRERLRRRWAARRQRLEDELLTVRVRAAQDEIALLEPLVRAEPQRAWQALKLQQMRRELPARRDELLTCAGRQLESDPPLARRCALLARRIAPGQDAAELIDRIDARLAARYAAREARVEARAERRQRSRIEASIERAEADLAAGNLSEAGDRLKRVLQTDPEHAEALRLSAELAEILAERSRVLNDLAARLYLEGQIEAATRVWQASLEIDPDQPEIAERLERARRVSERLRELRDRQPPSQDPPREGEASDDPPA